MSNSSYNPSSVNLSMGDIPDQRPLILALGISFMVAAIAFTAARFYARKMKGVCFEADDWTCLAALICCIGVCIDIIICAMLGNLGWQMASNGEDLSAVIDTFMIYSKTNFANEMVIWPAIGLTKISVLLLYKRIFGVSNIFRTLTWVLIAFVVALTITFTFSLSFACSPINSNWNFFVPTTCVNKQLLFTWAFATDVVTDGLILLLPAYNVWKLQMPIIRKISIIGIFMLGSLVAITGIIRIHYMALVFENLKWPAIQNVPADKALFIAITMGNANLTQAANAPVFYWSIIECCVGIVCACLPVMMPLVEKYRINIISSRLLSILSKSATSKTENSKRQPEDSVMWNRKHSSRDHFWGSLFSTSSRNDASSLASSIQLVDVRALK